MSGVAGVVGAGVVAVTAPAWPNRCHWERVRGPPCTISGARRGARAAESDGLENRCVLWAPWVQIPPPPLRKASHRPPRGGRCRVGAVGPATDEERKDVVHALLISLGVIFVAELGDKSQLMALAFAARYRALP